jgi:hypothetical protein
MEEMDSGVNEASGAGSIPTVEESPTYDDQSVQENETEEGSDDTQEASKEDSRFDKHPRFQKMQKTIRELKQYKSDLDTYKSTYQNAIEFHNWLTQNPKLIPKVMEALQGELGQDSAQQPEDVYADLDPKLAERFRSMEKALDEQKQEKMTSQQKATQEYLSSVDDHFDSLLEKDGFVKPNGQVDEDIVNMYSTHVRSLLDNFAQNPERPTLKEVNRAYDYVKKGVQKLVNRELSKITKTIPHAPPTGSKRGATPQNTPSAKVYTNADIERLLLG